MTGEELKKTLPYHPFLIKPNLEELEDLFGVRIKQRKKSNTMRENFRVQEPEMCWFP